jgi:hypothetical protein
VKRLIEALVTEFRVVALFDELFGNGRESSLNALIDLFEPLIDLFEPHIDLFEPFDHFFSERFHAASIVASSLLLDSCQVKRPQNARVLIITPTDGEEFAT